MRTLFLLLLIGLGLNLFAQSGELIYLWPGAVPGETKGKNPAVVDTSRKNDVTRITEVTDPVMEVFLPESSKANGGAVIICPGGAYRILAYDKEGTEIALWLNKAGYAAFVLQYRVPDKKDGALQDVQRALRLVRNDSKKYKIDPEKTGVIGFSAGGSLSARAATRFDEITYPAVDAADSISCRPSFAMLIYPAYLDQGPEHTLTPEINLKTNVPPVFIAQSADDTYANSALVMAGALRAAKLSVELHIFPDGGHGYGLRPPFRAANAWPLLAEEWLKGILNN